MMLYMKFNEIRYCSKRQSLQSSPSTQRLSIFFLGVLCELRGELICFFIDRTDRFRSQRPNRHLTPLLWGAVVPLCFFKIQTGTGFL